jgi:hypothetical protein
MVTKDAAWWKAYRARQKDERLDTPKGREGASPDVRPPVRAYPVGVYVGEEHVGIATIDDDERVHVVLVGFELVPIVRPAVGGATRGRAAIVKGAELGSLPSRDVSGGLSKAAMASRGKGRKGL